MGAIRLLPISRVLFLRDIRWWLLLTSAHVWVHNRFHEWREKSLFALQFSCTLVIEMPAIPDEWRAFFLDSHGMTQNLSEYD